MWILSKSVGPKSSFSNLNQVVLLPKPNQTLWLSLVNCNGHVVLVRVIYVALVVGKTGLT